MLKKSLLFLGRSFLVGQLAVECRGIRFTTREIQTNQMNKTEGQVVEFLDEVWMREKRDERVYLVCLVERYERNQTKQKSAACQVEKMVPAHRLTSGQRM
jgi:hypothetical protein